MVGGLIQKEDVGAADHELRDHDADLLSSGQDLDLLHPVLSREQHSPKEAADVSRVLDLGILGQPLGDGLIARECLGVVFREIGLGSGETPLVGTFVRLQFSRQDAEQSRLGTLVRAHQRHLVGAVQRKADVIQDLHALHSLRQVLHRQDLVSDIAGRTEIDEGIFPAGRTHLVQLDLFQGTFSGGRLL